MLPILIKVGLIAISLLAIFGMTYTVYEDSYLKIDASLTSFNLGTSEATIKLEITNKMNDDLHIIDVSYSVWADEAKTVLISSGFVAGFTIPANQKIEKVIIAQVENFEQIGDVVYVDAIVDYQLGNNEVDHQEVSKAFDLSSFGS